MGAAAPHGFARLGRKVECQKFGERLSAPDDRPETGGAQEIVAHPVPFREARFAREVRLGVEKIDGCGAGRVIDVEGTACQVFEEVPHAPGWNPGGCGADEGLEFGLRRRLEDALQDQEIDILMAESKGQMIGKGIAGPVAFIKDRPGPLFPAASANMLLRDATRPTHRPR